MDNVSADCERFYSLLTRLESRAGQGRKLGEYSNGRLPERGVYFFRETGETRRSGAGSQRVVRVGTHALTPGSKSTLWGRLKAHRGSSADGGNHRGSIFRLHVGAALMARDGSRVPSWGFGASAPVEVRDNPAIRDAERALEAIVSQYIARMTILWVEVPDDPGPDSMRAFIERNAIALLSNRFQPLDPASVGWLGLHSPRADIRRSNLWNLKFVNESYDARFLDILESAVKRT